MERCIEMSKTRRYEVTCHGSTREKEVRGKKVKVVLQSKEVEGQCGITKGGVVTEELEEFCRQREISKPERSQLGSLRRKRKLFQTIERKSPLFQVGKLRMRISKKQSLMTERQRLSHSHTMLVKTVSYLQDKNKEVEEELNRYRCEIETTNIQIHQTAEDLNAVEEHLAFKIRRNLRLPVLKIHVLDKKAALQRGNCRLFKRKQTAKRRLNF